jgi:hypothetical protein
VGHLDSQRSLPAIGADKTGFSPLAKKLRLMPGNSVLVINAPDGYLEMLRPGPPEMATEPQPKREYDVVVLFVNNADELRRMGATAIHAARGTGLLWIAYPKGGKKAAASDLPSTPWWVRRDVLGEITSVKGYKAVAFVAVDETWTALRFKRV